MGHGGGAGGNRSGYNSNENTIKIADPAAMLGRELSSKTATTSSSHAEKGGAGVTPTTSSGAMSSLSRGAAPSGDESAPSESTRKRAEATKQYLESLYQQRKSRDRAKQERRDSLEKQLKLEKKTNTEIEARLKALDVRLSLSLVQYKCVFAHALALCVVLSLSFCVLMREERTLRDGRDGSG